MVPVPEELVDEVKDYLGWQLAVPQIVDNPDALKTVLAEADEVLTTIVQTTAEATIDEIRPTLTEVSRSAGINMREIVGALADLNSRIRVAGRAAPLILVRPDPRPRPDEVLEWEHRIVHMLVVDAKAILGL